jgi:hypothetical protein
MRSKVRLIDRRRMETTAPGLDRPVLLGVWLVLGLAPGVFAADPQTPRETGTFG